MRTLILSSQFQRQAKNLVKKDPRLKVNFVVTLEIIPYTEYVCKSLPSPRLE